MEEVNAPALYFIKNAKRTEEVIQKPLNSLGDNEVAKEPKPALAVELKEPMKIIVGEEILHGEPGNFLVCYKGPTQDDPGSYGVFARDIFYQKFDPTKRERAKFAQELAQFHEKPIMLMIQRQAPQTPVRRSPLLKNVEEFLKQRQAQGQIRDPEGKAQEPIGTER